jgi:RNA-directed DNA polymerase
MATAFRIDYTRLLDLWRSIETAGGRDKYIQQQLKEKGFLIERKPTDNMSKAELDRYKKTLKEEAAEKRRLAKEAWQAYKAAHLVHLGEGVFWNDDLDHDKWDLPDAAERQAENELPKLDKPKQLAEALGVSIAELRVLAFHRDAATRLNYYRFTIPKRDGSRRPIWAPHRRLKAAQRWILREVVERLPVHGAAHGFLHGRSIATNAAVHTDAEIILKVDLKDFFPTVTLPRVKGIFRKAGYREQIATLLALLCTEAPREVTEVDGKQYFLALGPRCLPQGAPTSPGLTNTLCMRLDRRLQGAATSSAGATPATPTTSRSASPTATRASPASASCSARSPPIAVSEGFAVHPDKTRVSRSGGRQRVTGLVVNGKTGPRVPRDIKRQVRAALHNLANGKPLKEGETLSKLAGMVAYISMTDRKLGQKLRAQLSKLKG